MCCDCPSSSQIRPKGINLFAWGGISPYYAGMTWDKLRGRFLVLDGPDGAGKSTQLKLLEEVIGKQGVPVILARDPGGTAIGEKIRAILLDNGNVNMSVRCEALLYMASRAQLYSEVIAPALTAGKCVLCDRWVSSTYAYQAVAGKIGPEVILRLAEAALERTWPDLTIIVDLSGTEGLRRVKRQHDRMEAKGVEFHEKVRQAFLDLARTRPDFRVVDGTGSVTDVHERLCAVVEHYVHS
jgi:dTMP kinase